MRVGRAARVAWAAWAMSLEAAGQLLRELVG